MPKYSLESCIETANQIMQDNAYTIKTARNPKTKRAAQNTYDYWSSISEHLTNYQKSIS